MLLEVTLSWFEVVFGVIVLAIAGVATGWGLYGTYHTKFAAEQKAIQDALNKELNDVKAKLQDALTAVAKKV